jgi:hypothetical protein
MQVTKLITLFVVPTICWIGSAFADSGKNESGKGKREHLAVEIRDVGRDSYFHRRGYTRLQIPKGHYPPPGECRIWYPDRPAGHQPPPGNCRSLRVQVPPGAWLIRHPDDDPEHVHISVYDDRRPGVVSVIGQFKIGTGVFVRVVVDR